MQSPPARPLSTRPTGATLPSAAQAATPPAVPPHSQDIKVDHSPASYPISSADSGPCLLRAPCRPWGGSQRRVCVLPVEAKSGCCTRSHCRSSCGDANYLTIGEVQKALSAVTVRYRKGCITVGHLACALGGRHWRGGPAHAAVGRISGSHGAGLRRSLSVMHLRLPPPAVRASG